MIYKIDGSYLKIVSSIALEILRKCKISHKRSK